MTDALSVARFLRNQWPLPAGLLNLAAEIAAEVRLLWTIGIELAAHGTVWEAAYKAVDPEGLARSLPGVAEVGGPAIVAAMGEPQRFAKGKRFRSFTGLVP